MKPYVFKKYDAMAKSDPMSNFYSKEEARFCPPLETLICSICARKTPHRYLEKHHLIPECKKGEKTTTVCVDCGNQIHKLFTIQELAKTYNTIEALTSDPRMQTWIRWIRKRKEFGFCMKEKKRK